MPNAMRIELLNILQTEEDAHIMQAEHPAQLRLPAWLRPLILQRECLANTRQNTQRSQRATLAGQLPTPAGVSFVHNRSKTQPTLNQQPCNTAAVSDWQSLCGMVSPQSPSLVRAEPVCLQLQPLDVGPGTGGSTCTKQQKQHPSHQHPEFTPWHPALGSPATSTQHGAEPRHPRHTWHNGSECMPHPRHHDAMSCGVCHPCRC